MSTTSESPNVVSDHEEADSAHYAEMFGFGFIVGVLLGAVAGVLLGSIALGVAGGMVIGGVLGLAFGRLA
jgi:F0F1-type ATP synthase assembly protein I